MALGGGANLRLNLEADHGAVAAGGDDAHRPALRHAGLHALESEQLRSIQPELAPALAFAKAQRQDAHADQVGPVDALERFGDDGLHAQQRRALGRPVAAAARAVFLAAQHDDGNTVALVGLRRLVHGGQRAVGEVQRPAALAVGRERIAQPHVGKGAADHHFEVTAPSDKGIEIARRHAGLHQVLAGRCVHRNFAAG